MRLILISLLCLELLACGQKGPLYLPDPADFSSFSASLKPEVMVVGYLQTGLSMAGVSHFWLLSSHENFTNTSEKGSGYHYLGASEARVGGGRAYRDVFKAYPR